MTGNGKGCVILFIFMAAITVPGIAFFVSIGRRQKVSSATLDMQMRTCREAQVDGWMIGAVVLVIKGGLLSGRALKKNQYFEFDPRWLFCRRRFSAETALPRFYDASRFQAICCSGRNLRQWLFFLSRPRPRDDGRCANLVRAKITNGCDKLRNSLRKRS